LRVVVQRTKEASVTVNNEVIGKIKQGFLLLVAFTHTDAIEDVEYCARKVSNLRVFEDENQKMNLSIHDVGGSILSISQFTLYGDVSKGNRPSFIESARPEQAIKLYDAFNDILRKKYNLHVETGIFGVEMKVALINDGPVTIIIDSHNR